jgi:hypothetical protein
LRFIALRQPLPQRLHQLLGLLGTFLRLFSGVRFLRRLLAQLLCLCDGLGTGLLRLGSGPTTCLLSRLLGYRDRARALAPVSR